MKRLVSLLLAMAVCLGLGGTALAAENGGPALPRLDTALGICENYELSVNDEYVAYGMDSFQCASATVALGDIDRAFGYIQLLRDGPFQLEMTYCDELVYEPGTTAYLAAFDYAGGGDAGILPPGGVPVGGGQALGVMIYPDQEAGTADILAVCGRGFSFTDSWDGDEAAPEEVMEEAPPEPVVAQATAPAAEGAVLPDPVVFFHESVEYMTYYHDYSYVYIALKAGSRGAMEEYIAHLREERFGLTLLRDFEESSTGYDSIHHYVFDYTGPADVPAVNWAEELSYKDESRTQVGTGDLWIEMRSKDASDGGSIECTLQISYANDAFSFADFGGRSTGTDLYFAGWFGQSTCTGPVTADRFDRPESETEGGSSDGSGSYESSGIATDDRERTKMRVPCTKCHGSGEVDCSRCGGDKGRWVYDSVPDYSGHGNTTVRTWESCSKCYGTGQVTCPVCDGDRYVYV